MPVSKEQSKSPGIKIIREFPNPKAVKYDEALWYEQHGRNLVIINCEATEIRFPEHWTPLSIKCAIGGKEYYHFKHYALAVSENNFLILNEGANYSSSIESQSAIESFTLNFTNESLREVFAGTSLPSAKQLDQPHYCPSSTFRFQEKLYPHNNYLSHTLSRIRSLTREKGTASHSILELMYSALEDMIMLNKNTSIEIDQIKASTRSTREELYKRLNLARDYMDSCYFEEISLHHLSRICFLNPHYLLRQYKLNFGSTPHQYLMLRRLQEAELLLRDSTLDVSLVAKKVGYYDLSSFSKLFRRYAGLSPEKYRFKIQGMH